MPGDPYKLRLLHPNCTCGDCIHYSEEGCPEAAEALSLDGWPRITALVGEDMSAESCPEFKDKTPTPWEDAVDRAYQKKKEGAA
jgi:hypothetical protein